MTKDSKILLFINNVIALLSILICAIYAIIYYNMDDYFLMIASIGAAIVPIFIYFIDKIIKRKMPISLKTVFLIFYFISAPLGAIANLYTLVPYYDKFVHFTSGILVSWLFILGYTHFIKNKYNDIKIFLLFLNCFNATIALLWEILEFSLDFIIKREFQKGLTDTMLDTIVAVIGGLIVTVIYLRKHKRK